MVSNPIKVTIESIVGSFMYHAVIPIVTIRKENSLICPNADHVRKLFFIVCPSIDSIIMVMSGFMNKTKRENTIHGTIIAEVIFQKSTWDQSETKKITMKKSFNGLILLVISN